MSEAHYVPAGPAEVELEVKKSRFIARAEAVADREQAMTVLAEARARYPDARHHCWAYVLGDPASARSAAMNDDGEPGGTAGKPILNVIQHKQIGDVMVVVSRYFGGVKLGAGGLVRAYSGATEAVLSALSVRRPVHRDLWWLELGFAQEQACRHWAAAHGASVQGVVYGKGVRLGLEVPRAQVQALEAWCAAQGARLRRAD
ncbi:IMPACT family protein [Alkalilimnicola sp. S0819]|uniref:IMPACT family protein n=1 Tax=Alkalilimnicola sp. S0819 TaxID=2613922 RepID=UPI0012615FF7|nr:YigZ family protein [Alkalilimnicola sp. S0819]KAB7624306.1 YigZ family protein [Alkalilimnicola sp. S0819]MPQ16130.1 DUF1949 domain-containing protein [Alkalilimnicola sp. S0819]